MLASGSDAEVAAVVWLRTAYQIDDPAYPINAIVQAAGAAHWDVHLLIGGGAYMAVRVTHTGSITRLPTGELASD
jgi:hypothetical protein